MKRIESSKQSLGAQASLKNSPKKSISTKKDCGKATKTFRATKIHSKTINRILRLRHNRKKRVKTLKKDISKAKINISF